MLRENDTIVALSTPIGESGIGIVRMSGSDSIPILSKIFFPKNKKRFQGTKSFTIHYGYVKDKENIIDEVLVYIMKAPHTYTREDVAEISCHGGVIPLQKTLQLCLDKGAKMSQPGEFTKRAFLNGRLDLAQAEAVCDVIRAQTSSALNCALSQLEGTLTSQIKEIQQILIELLAHIEVSLDYAEEDIPSVDSIQILENIERAESAINDLLSHSEEGLIIRDGLKVIITGKPNAGKSSLLNALLKQEKAIVTPIPGTTRDIVEEVINIKGVPTHLMDTCGIRRSRNQIEVIGLEKARVSLKYADLVLMVIDLSRSLTRQDREIADEIKEKKIVICCNKLDLSHKTSISQIRKLFPNKKSLSIVRLSAKTGKGINELRETIYNLFITDKGALSEGRLVTNIRHKDALKRALESLEQAKSSLSAKSSEEFIALDIRQTLDALGEIIGETTTEDILDNIFSNFCVGK